MGVLSRVSNQIGTLLIAKGKFSLLGGRWLGTQLVGDLGEGQFVHSDQGVCSYCRQLWGVGRVARLVVV